jgi:hypothetical protein
MTVTASIALPHDDVRRATAELRGDLRMQIAATHPGQLPDWTTLVVTGPARRVGKYGRTWFDWSATVETRSSR